MYPSPDVHGDADGNEATSPSATPVWAEPSVWPQDPGFRAARAGGITSLQILPGSLVGGRSMVLKNVPSVTDQGMRFPGAPQGLAMTCGEPPRRVNGGQHAFPSTPAVNLVSDRAQWAEADAYQRSLTAYQQRLATGVKDARPPERDLRLETLAAVLRGEILVQIKLKAGQAR